MNVKIMELIEKDGKTTPTKLAEAIAFPSLPREGERIHIGTNAYNVQSVGWMLANEEKGRKLKTPNLKATIFVVKRAL